MNFPPDPVSEEALLSSSPCPQREVSPGVWLLLRHLALPSSLVTRCPGQGLQADWVLSAHRHVTALRPLFSAAANRPFSCGSVH